MSWLDKAATLVTGAAKSDIGGKIVDQGLDAVVNELTSKEQGKKAEPTFTPHEQTQVNLSQPKAEALPAWAIPAGIGALLLLVVFAFLGRRKK